ncbi:MULTISPECIES: diacylglycerol kinase family protein [unclassified Polaribacter]|jgi:YegS/Rv2252/BmrU family lipid kinase|uniref:diacylglycerol/lipid kinase family protein n=1 Tax=unclassified Polaribacter TaxID=196858 RepID=UPI00052C5426|nr:MULTISPECIES: diacylglycerol kinase family protein [unclassified Polaribacter]KGL60123.1 diacylglycerol kinase [Polaribacter sp. Hel1_33_49]PKV66134.1 YegS/Rv2252/BmrU family lipid kinase [Polaribacter sp. Hel1_33_96]
MSNPWFIIANPIAGNRKFSIQWKEIQQLLNNKNIDYSFAFTQFSKHEIELAQNAIQQGFRNIISVGGDGTLHHVVNGIMLQRYVKTSDITIGVIPLGTGNDWIKTYNIPNDVEKAIEIIHHKKTILQDIGVIKTKNKSKTYFNNVAGLGYDGYIVHKLKTLKHFGSIAYLLSGLAGLFFYKKTVFKITFNNKSIETNCLMALIGICKFSGGGMQFTKDVNTTDGLFDITIAKNLNIFDLICNIKKLYNGHIVYHKKIETYKTKLITVIPKTSKAYIQADGELIGTGKVSFQIISRAINFVIYSK